MSYGYLRFANTLSEEDRGVLFGAVPFLTALVARADGKYTLREKIARWKTFVATKTELDSAFVSPDAVAEVERYLDRVKAESEATEDVHSDVLRELRKIAAVIKQMPPSLRERFEDFIVWACFGVAEASGRFLWIGEELSPEEITTLQLIIKELKLTVSYPEIRERLSLS